MTLVFDRGAVPDHPITHALVIGCGRFPHRQGLDRLATVAGARRMMEFLSIHAEQFVAPIWTIRCLLSETGIVPGTDTLGVQLAKPKLSVTIAKPGDPVDSVIKGTVEAEGERWLAALQARPGDHAFFYMSSHGIADTTSALGLFEDVLSNSNKKWSQSLNVTTLALGLGTLGLGRAWLFLDACQDVVKGILGSPTGTPGLHLIELEAQALTRARTSMAMAGSKFGKQAWAPTNGDPPFFTQALLEGLADACVEPVQDLGWAVTAERLLFDLPKLAEIAFGHVGLETEPLTRFNESDVGLLKVAQPMIPVALSTEVEGDLPGAELEVVCDDTAVAPIQRPAGAPDLVWRFRVEAHKRRSFIASAAFPGGEPVYGPVNFDPEPPGQMVRLRSMP